LWQHQCFFVGLATLVSDYNKAHLTDEAVVVNLEEVKARSAADEAAKIKKAAEDKVIKFVWNVASSFQALRLSNHTHYCL
jgi:hypothetical protein